LFFNGASSREGSRVGVVLISPTDEVTSLSYKLEFETTKFEALILGLKVAIEMGVNQIFVFGDSELIIQQVKSIYQENHPKLRSYRNEVLDI
jgi:ribonuclease HI